MSELKTEKEMVSLQEEVLRSTKELNDTIRDILENGTFEQKVELLIRDYKQRMINEELQKSREVQIALLNNSLSAYKPVQFPLKHE